MVLVGAAVLPHGAMPFDGDPNSESAACRERNAKLSPAMNESLSKLYEGTMKAASMLSDLLPDLIFICSPHGICLSGAYGIYLNPEASGDAMWLNLWSEFKASASLNVKCSDEFLTHLLTHKVPAQGITSFAGLSAQLRWGEVIPIWYLQKHLKNEPKYMIMTTDRALRPAELEAERLKAGSIVGQFVRGLEERVVVVISGDLAHTHHTDCKNPIYTPDTKYFSSSGFVEHPAEATDFDESIHKWAKSGKQIDSGDESAAVYEWDQAAAIPHLKSAMSIGPELSAACGAKGLQLLHGLLTDEIEHNAAKFTSHTFVYQAPTYYGMMATIFSKQQ